MSGRERPHAFVMLCLLTLCWGGVMRNFGAREIYWLVGGYALFASAAVYTLFPRDIRRVFRANARIVAIGAGVGVVMTLATYPAYRLAVRAVPALAPVVAGLYRTSHREHMGTALGWVLVIIAAEELVFRGVWLSVLERRIGRARANYASVALYVVAQACTGSLTVALLAACCGALWTIERRLTHSLVAPLISHLIWTPVVILLYPVVP